jgi:hypothetical protein
MICPTTPPFDRDEADVPAVAVVVVGVGGVEVVFGVEGLRGDTENGYKEVGGDEHERTRQGRRWSGTRREREKTYHNTLPLNMLDLMPSLSLPLPLLAHHLMLLLIFFTTTLTTLFFLTRHGQKRLPHLRLLTQIHLLSAPVASSPAVGGGYPRSVPDRLLYHAPVASPEEEGADDDGGADAEEEDEGR